MAPMTILTSIPNRPTVTLSEIPEFNVAVTPVNHDVLLFDEVTQKFQAKHFMDYAQITIQGGTF